MAIIQDIKPIKTDSAYVQKTFHEAKAELEANGYSLLSLEEFAKIRILYGKNHSVSKYGSYTKEGFVYVPNHGKFLTRNSPIMANTLEATKCQIRNTEFYLNSDQVEEALADSIKIKEGTVPTDRFEDNEIMVYFFQDLAKPYGEFLKGVGIKEMPIHLANLEEKPFARQTWLHGIDEGYGSCVDGDGRELGYSSAVRGIRDLEMQSDEKLSLNYGPDLQAIMKYSKKFVPEFAREEFKKGLENFFK